MQAIPIGDKDTLPALGLGTWKSAPGAVYSAVKEALAAGYRHVDCAPIYQNENEIGRALAESFASGAATRQQVWLTSKLWNSDHAPADVRPALERTLRDLQVDYVDLFLIHWPVVFKPGVLFARKGEEYLSLDAIPISETWQALEACVEQGLTRHIGVCNFSQKKLQDLVARAAIKPVMNQVEMHPYLQQNELLEYCQRHKILVTAYSPLGSGDRPDGMKKRDEPRLLDNPVVAQIAARAGATPAQVLLAWGLGRGTIVIPKSVNPERLRQNLAAAELALSGEDMAELAALDCHYRYVDASFFQGPGSPYTMQTIWDE